MLLAPVLVKVHSSSEIDMVESVFTSLKHGWNTELSHNWPYMLYGNSFGNLLKYVAVCHVSLPFKFLKEKDF